MAGTAFDLSTVRWSKSSYSNGSGGNCVEVADQLPAFPGAVPVRDSKRAQEGPVLFFAAPAWTSFLTSLKR